MAPASVTLAAHGGEDRGLGPGAERPQFAPVVVVGLAEAAATGELVEQ